MSFKYSLKKYGGIKSNQKKDIHLTIIGAGTTGSGRKLIGKIKDALERLSNETYGICEACGEEISEARLKARPVTTLCIDCKKRQETDEKVRGL